MSTTPSAAPTPGPTPETTPPADPDAPARAGIRLDEDRLATVVGLVLLLAVLVGLVPAGSVP